MAHDDLAMRLQVARLALKVVALESIAKSQLGDNLALERLHEREWDDILGQLLGFVKEERSLATQKELYSGTMSKIA